MENKELASREKETSLGGVRTCAEDIPYIIAGNSLTAVAKSSFCKTHKNHSERAHSSNIPKTFPEEQIKRKVDSSLLLLVERQVSPLRLPQSIVIRAPGINHYDTRHAWHSLASKWATIKHPAAPLPRIAPGPPTARELSGDATDGLGHERLMTKRADEPPQNKKRRIIFPCRNF
ncbi:hypothetical protein TNCV_2206821 [Trichonephila clavipes]|uniref:Uncharacterized protein n=1 Tax=Trichonephila clavipes TaxID=2585209 RepID=A0A8X6S3S0_TRICX|nr:hypothetical protein TNCV_2206821 [Trichonephila clavipes]